ncbi:hypothetical protein L596_023270 [Steinernema carpocapsae]|uniref:Fibronectin type III domain protein n=1 Tax=Steinernema carpocapsae TaxID=34508 RepID=A0A4U5MD53_STECR|nr:hypothetical protein L596_023270 [Steinernema carpocapsae]
MWNAKVVEDGKDEFRIYDITPIDSQDMSKSKLIAQTTTQSGTVTCQAVNPHGSDEKRNEVKIQGPGSAPLNIRPTPFQNGFNVDWDPPAKPNGPVKAYIVYYTKDPDAPLSDWQKMSVPGDKTDATIMVDDEDTPYTIRVQAANDDGPGIISEPYDVTTGKKHIPLTVRLEVLDPPVTEGEETVVKPTQTIRFRCVAEGRPTPSVSYTWLPLNETESGVEPIPMRIDPNPDKEHSYVSIDVNSNTQSKRALLCQAKNPDGIVDDRQVFNVKQPGSPPTDIVPTVDVDNHVTIEWQPPKHPNGDIKTYNIYLSADPSKPMDQWQKFTVPADGKLVQEFMRGQLEPETPYYVKITAENDDGEGPLSDLTRFETKSGAPIDAPTDVLPTVADDNTVTLAWTAPRIPNGPLKSYTIYYTPDDGTALDEDYKNWPKMVVPANGDTGTATIDKDNIDPKKKYKVRISATNDMSEGPASDPVTFDSGSGEIPPTIILEPSENPVNVPPKGNLQVLCRAEGIPTPTVKWVIHPDGEVIEGSVLRLTDLRKDASATCLAENNAGKTQEVLQILVAGPGSPPNEIVTMPTGNQEINVEWTTPDDTNGKVTDYIIHYGEIDPDSPNNEPRVWEETKVPADQVTHRLPGLKPKTKYAVRIQAVSDRGPGVKSDPQILRTLPKSPDAPEQPKVVVHDNNTVVVSFDAPKDPEDPSKPIRDFVVKYTSDDPATDDSEWKELTWKEPDDTDGHVSIPIDGENFSPDTKYTVKVIPRGEVDGPDSEPTVFTTGDGVIPPEKPVINVDAPDNIIKVPAETDYTVSCTSNGFPPPFVRWVDEKGNQISEGAMLKLQDIKETVKARCVAENVGGIEETPFTIYVAGPGNAPDNIRLSSDKPRTISVTWDPPTIPNGNITRYIVYYTPLDDQDPTHQIGQVPKRPISEWMTYHVVGEHLNDGEQRADLTDFVEPDTAYAVVIQAANDDGPGPYSSQHTARTMSRARKDLQPISEWNPQVNARRRSNGRSR